MEIEAKFGAPNRDMYRDLLRLRQIGDYKIVPLGRVRVEDRYFDTADGRLLAGGYSCRLRTQDGSVIATLKGLGESAGAVHRRDEQEVALPALLLNPAEWPASPARDLALKLTGGAPLQPLFDLHQLRGKADLMQDARRVAEWSLDEVRAVVGKRPAFYYELEIELGPDGTEADLATVGQALQAQFALTPERRSKFIRGLEMLRARGAAIEGGLSAEERAALQALSADGDAELARRAATVLGWADALPTREIVARTGLSAGRVRFWLRAFRARRMEIFAGEPIEPAADKATVRASAAAASAAPGETGESPKTGNSKRGDTNGKKQGLPRLNDFCRQHGVDIPRARFVADSVDALFDGLRGTHGLPKKRVKLARAAALLAEVGAGMDPEEPARAGRDLILAQPLRGVSTADRLALACIVALQREKMKPNKEPALEALDPKERKEVIAIATLLQMASSLSGGDARAQDGPTQIADVDCGEDRCDITLTGPAAEPDAILANERARYWRDLFKHDARFSAQQDAAPATTAAASAARAPAAAKVVEPAESAGPIPELPPMAVDDSMAEAGRKAMFTHFMKMLANEAGTREGADIEFLHDMRVSTRRLRAAYRIFEPFYDADAVAQFNKDLRKAGRVLGAVRDLDVLIEKAQAHEAGLPADAGLTVAPLVDHWAAQREVARRDLLRFLDGQAYGRFVEGFRTFLLTPGAGAQAIPEGEPVAHQVRHVLPRLVMERYEQVRAYEPIMENAPLTTYHMLRIDCKRLRYALEFFQKLLGPDAPAIIKQVTAMQELLGAMQDAHVAESMIADYLAQEAGRKKRRPAPPGVEAYLQTQRQIQQDLLTKFAPPWIVLTGLDFRRSLGAALATP